MTSRSVSAAEICAARERAADRDRIEPRVDCASFDAKKSMIVLALRSRAIVAFPVDAISELEGATPKQLRAVRPSFGGEAITIDVLDVDISVQGLLRDLVGIGTAASLLGARGGRVTSKAKALAVRENGKKGGRPRKKALA